MSVKLQKLQSYFTGRCLNVSWRGVSHQLITVMAQGSVFALLLFSIYASSLSMIIKSHDFSNHCYADVTQLCHFNPMTPLCQPVSLPSFQIHLESLSPAYTCKVGASCNSCQLFNWAKHHCSTGIYNTNTNYYSKKPGASVFKVQLSFNAHILTTAQSCGFMLYYISKIRPFMSEYATQS